VKRIFLLSFLLLAFMVPMLAVAQTGAYSRDAVFAPAYPGETLRFTCALDSVDLDTSRAFTLGKYDGAFSLATFPI